MSIVNFGECSCDCHKPGIRVMHMKACCTVCEFCSMRIKDGLMGVHLSNCAAKKRNDTSNSSLHEAMNGPGINWADVVDPLGGIRKITKSS